ncbi:arginase family protein [Aestuariibaculum suncheonense]|uniref:Arginase family protein n=1 Tax=Aestuariibaculum suncheonense TaxID=1028745 RepID=A0A8J6Q428_9FLAO|nr:arginase family protein [Aestuariibaculum suncheonense]MBD0834232.1 arginase family protein [Aestuariibaculum suncheonense]
MKTNTYANISEDLGKLDSAKIVLVPVSFEDSNTVQKGSAYGFEAFLAASGHMELYDIETNTEVYQQGIHLTETISDDLAEAMVEAVHQNVKKYIKKNKFVTLFGGEHTTSIGAIRAFNEMYPSLTVLHLGAHANVRKSNNGSVLNKACAVYEASQFTNLIQVGVRSMSVTEKTVVDEEKIYFAHEMAIDDSWTDSAIDQMTDNVFINFNLNALDISIMPNTASPMPGGLFWYETLEFLKQVFAEKNVVGFDIVELCPNPQQKASDFLAAKLYYKMLSYKFMDEEVGDDYDNTYDNSKQKNNISKFNEDDEY